VIVVERGSIVFGLPDEGRELDLAAGDRLELPAGTRHDAVVGGTGVTCWGASPGGGIPGAARRAAGEWSRGTGTGCRKGSSAVVG
jgi:uncharacterized protein YjlB